MASNADIPDEAQLTEPEVLYCRDQRWHNLCDRLFSPEMKIPSIKFALVATYGGFLGLCMLGAGCDSLGLHLVARAIKSLIRAWLIFTASLVDPIYLTASHPATRLAVIPFLIVAVVLLIRQALQKILQPSEIHIVGDGLVVLYGKYGSLSNLHIKWDDIHAVELEKTPSHPNGWWIVIVGKGKDELLRFQRGLLNNNRDRMRLLDAIAMHGSGVLMSPELVAPVPDIKAIGAP